MIISDCFFGSNSEKCSTSSQRARRGDRRLNGNPPPAAAAHRREQGLTPWAATTKQNAIIYTQ